VKRVPRIVIVTSDRGESLGEHDHFFDHTQNLYGPSMRIPLRRDPGETRDVGSQMPEALRANRDELEGFRARIDAQRTRTRRLLEGRSGEERLSPEACEKLKAMGYIQQACT
jgi:hypothetical protein